METTTSESIWNGVWATCTGANGNDTPLMPASAFTVSINSSRRQASTAALGNGATANELAGAAGLPDAGGAIVATVMRRVFPRLRLQHKVGFPDMQAQRVPV